uniref:Retrotransposon gag domain-containing protein n=1 Tax=Xenopus tropicalis TaxID=8364 RepID=A0A803JAE8_XENTR
EPPCVPYNRAMDQEEDASPLTALTQQIAALAHAVRELRADYNEVQEQLQAIQYPAPPPAPMASPPPLVGATASLPAPEPKVPLPDKFSGDRSTFRTFVNACKLLFMLQPQTYSTEQVKVGVVMSLLRGQPQSWAFRLMEQQNACLLTVDAFFQAMAVLYDDPHRVATAEAALRNLRQGTRPVEDFTMNFRKFAADTDWNQAALKHQFRLGLSATLKDELARVGVPDSLEELIQLSIQIDQRLRERRLEKASSFPASWVLPKASPPIRVDPEVTTSPEPEPMQLGSLRPSLSSEERIRRRRLNLCLYCGLSGHLLSTCPTRPSPPRKVPSLSTTVPKLHFSPLLTFSLSLQWEDKVLVLPAILDSGASGCFLDSKVADCHKIPLLTKSLPLLIRVADGSPISSGPILKESIPLRVCMNKIHSEMLSFDVVASPLSPIIIGLPWLRKHNPIVEWERGKITFSSHFCRTNCLSSPPSACQKLCCVAFEKPFERFPGLPSEYYDFLDVFDKKGADSLPPHRKYDCPIDLLPGSQIPFGRIYPLAEPELKVLRDYLEENLTKGFIRTSTSPAGAGIFFVEKKDHTLRPCIDYRNLNNITVKNRYPLPLIPELFQRLREAT